ncbi:hypothetical protein [uncultured Ornithinimicrobium sp.]|uniref:hypothetical protein n=1 Tax=uncultured Ornithinimicrobium sp. TaxID=259307 RepID=UPI002599E0B4|nr:hypothetical protein [uncultured Ornithinimicrobium sp.]
MESELVAQSQANWRAYKRWADSVSEWCMNDFAVADFEISHAYHGSHENRLYDVRRDYLRGFDLTTDVVHDPNGLPQWSPSARRTKASMVRRVEGYFSLRREDE